MLFFYCSIIFCLLALLVCEHVPTISDKLLTHSQWKLNICGHKDFLNIHTTYFSTGCCYITPIHLSNIPVVMATLNIYSYRWVKLQKKCVYPQLSQQMTHLEDEGFLRQTAPLHPDARGCLCSLSAALLKNYRTETRDKLNCNKL